MISFKSTKFGADGLGFAIPSNHFKKYTSKPESVDENSLLKNDIKVGNILLEINSISVKNITDYYEIISYYDEQSELVFLVNRNGEKIKINVFNPK